MTTRKKSKSKATEGDEDGQVPFEALLEQLEGIVGNLEEGEISLEESLAAYERGVILVRRAQDTLDNMDSRLQQLMGDGSIAPLDLDAAEDDAAH